MSQDNQTLQQRREKAEALAQMGAKLYANDFSPENLIADILPRGEGLAPETSETGGHSYSVAGRILSVRKFGYNEGRVLC